MTRRRQPGPDLFAAHREHDLPPRWDDHPVTWDPWADQPHAFICPPPRERHVCPACGSLTPPVTTTGRVTTPDTPTHVVRLLTATRCPDCRHDVVHDLTTRQTWDLDPTDYGPTGSTNPQETP